jgi:hypothetical protein
MESGGRRDKVLLSSIGLVSLGILLTSRVPSQSNTNNPSVLGRDCTPPVEIIRRHGTSAGIDPHSNDQFFVGGRPKGTLNTTDNCVQRLSPEKINDLKQAQEAQAQAQQQGQ